MLTLPQNAILIYSSSPFSSDYFSSHSPHKTQTHQHFQCNSQRNNAPSEDGVPRLHRSIGRRKEKIQVFPRELPLSLELVTQAIEACKQQLSGTMMDYNLNGQSECSDQTSMEEGPKESAVVGKTNASASGKSPSSPPVPATSSTGPARVDNGGSSKREEKGQSQRKQRRCWSQELHKRFLQALHQLGGADTPLFLVGNIYVQPPEYAVATTTSGELTTVTAPTGIYAPVAAHPTAVQHTSAPAVMKAQLKQLEMSEHSHSEERANHSEGAVHSNSPASSSSTHTTTNSPRC
ncbi:hypothetical protein SESBI_38275 [Sesbania bispinosa]|nr:hypothetical protein SESBI_38275 [Sesbania bispinosa]